MLSPIYAIIPGVLVMLIAILVMYRKKKSAYRIVLFALFIIYITGVICVTFFPVDYVNVVDDNFDISLSTLKLIPFEMICNMVVSYEPFVPWVEIGGNILMTIPLGIMLPMILPGKKKLFYFLTFLAFTVSIESLQLFVGFLLGTFYRTADIDDVILNFTGAVIGFFIYKFIPEKVKQKFSCGQSKDTFL